MMYIIIYHSYRIMTTLNPLLLISLFFSASAYVITTNYNYNIDNCTIVPLHGNYYKTIIEDELQIYSESILEKTDVEEFIIVKNIKHNKKDICGFYSYSNSIIVLSSNAICGDITHTLHHELYHAFDASVYMKNNTDEWTSLNEYPYTINYNSILLQEGFINNYAMYNIKEDKAEHYEELMTAKKDTKYDDIIKNKFKLLIESLILYDFTFFDIIITRSNKNKFFKNIIDSIIVLNTDPETQYGKQTIVLSSIDYTEDEDNFMNNYKVDLAHQSEKEKYILLSNKYLDKLYKIEPLILTIENDMAHLYGWMLSEQEYNIPSYINTKSIMKRYLWGESRGTINNIILHNNKLKYHVMFNNCISGYLNGHHVCYVAVNIHFKL
jgi:hypothetical protein